MKKKFNKRILIVEDDPDDQYFLLNAFIGIDSDINISCVENGVELFDYFERLDEDAALPDLIILDLNMPQMNGKEVLTRIKKIDSLKALPVVVFSTSKSEIEVKEIYQLGANTFIVKPLTFQKVSDVVQNIYNYWFLTAERMTVTLRSGKEV